MSKDPYRYFRVEARELLEHLGKGTLELERGGGADVVQRLLRVAHTLKGAARVVKQREIADAAHAIEEVLGPHRDGTGAMQRTGVDTLLGLVDKIGTHISALAHVSAPVPETQSAGAAAAAPDSSSEQPAPQAPALPARNEEALRTVRADVTEVDALLEGLTEAHVQLGTLRRMAAQAEQARHLAEIVAEQLAPRTSRVVDVAAMSKAYALADELRSLSIGMERGLGGGVEALERELRQVREAAEHLRLLPAGSLFSVLDRVARDAAQALGKSVVFEGRGGEVRIDAHVLSGVQAALVQIVRNAVAHGVEAPAARRSASKPAVGRVVVEILRRGQRVVFRCSDDGQGVDVAAVRRVAAERGLAPPDVEALTPDALVSLLLRGGISTATTVTEVSGRGIGLDVVRESIERLGGDVHVRSERGRGTELELVVPLTLASIEALTVESAGIVVTLPLDAVRRTLRVAAEDLSRTAEGESLLFEGKVIPFVPLPRALRGGRAAAHGVTSTTRASSAVIVEAGGRMAALGVERLLGTGSVVLRPMPALAPADPIVAGASLDAEGNPRLVLDPQSVIDAAQRVMGTATAVEARRPLLVVDDSLTTRMLERSILESAGYEVDVGTSAEEGLAMARARAYALILSDVEMPGMDGFAFVEHVRADPTLRTTPMILVTSRNAPEDRARGERVGANGYIVKSEFDQSVLLTQIRKLLDRA